MSSGACPAAEPDRDAALDEAGVPEAMSFAGLPRELGSREGLRAEVDRILDKINSQGFGALTADEKRLLDDAHDLLSKR